VSYISSDANVELKKLENEQAKNKWKQIKKAISDLISKLLIYLAAML